jgi:integrase
MKVTLTDPMVRAAKPQAKPYELRDAGVAGFGLRVSTKGARSWSLVYRPRGSTRQQRVSLGPYPIVSLAQAREEARRLLARVHLGDDPALERRQAKAAPVPAPSKPTFADLVARYVQAKQREGKRSLDEDTRTFGKYLPGWHTRPADGITRADVRAALAALVDGDRPTMANRTFAALRGLFAFGLREEIVPINPCAGLMRPAPERQRDRVLSRDEIRRLWGALEHEDQATAALFKLALLTGARGYEVRTMKHDDRDGDQWTVPAERTKNKASYRVPLSRQARAILDALPRVDGSPFVFPGPGRRGYRDSITKATKRIRASARLDFWPHDLRRSMATFLASDLDVPQELIARLLNHSDGSITKVYNRATYDTKRQRRFNAGPTT